MPAPNDLSLNDRIALAKGWTWIEELYIRTKPGAIAHYDKWLQEDLIEKETTHWCNPQGEPALRPDFVGTLKGVGGMLRELNDKETEKATANYDWAIRWSRLFQIWDIWAENGYSSSSNRLAQFQSTEEEGFGVAVGEAWMSMFGEKERDASSE